MSLLNIVRTQLFAVFQPQGAVKAKIDRTSQNRENSSCLHTHIQQAASLALDGCFTIQNQDCKAAAKGAVIISGDMCSVGCPAGLGFMAPVLSVP